MIRTKADIEYHGRDNTPAVNVKVYKSMRSVPLPLDLGSVSSDGKTFEPITTDPRFTHDWVEEHIPEDDYNLFQFACESGWEWLEMCAQDIWQGCKVYSEGRSGGWAIVSGGDFNPNVDEWDAIEFGKWRKFARIARDIADDIPRSMLDLAYANDFEQWLDAQEQERIRKMYLFDPSTLGGSDNA